MSGKKIGVVSLGCRLNTYEIDSIITSLIEDGYEIDNNSADIYIVNSCVVTARSEAKTRNFINRFLKRGAKVIVAGCMANEIKKDDNILYVPNDLKCKIPKIVREIDNFFIDKDLSSRFDYKAPYLTKNTRVNVKIQDGCDNFCSYCILPYIRGSVPLSRPAYEVENEVKLLLDRGFKEIVITGLNISKYNFEGLNLTKLIEILLKLDANFRIHFSSINPEFIDEDFIEILMSPKIVKHLHLSLQHGSNRILKLMNRKYSIERVKEIVFNIREKDQFFNFTADIICGFPTETEEDHVKNMLIIKDLKLYHTHIFKYSDRPRTVASQIDDKIKEEVKKKRSIELEKVALESKIKVLESFSNKFSNVLIEEVVDNISYGLNEYYIPIYVNSTLSINEFYLVSSRFNKDRLVGKVCYDNSK